MLIMFCIICHFVDNKFEQIANRYTMCFVIFMDFVGSSYLHNNIYIWLHVARHNHTGSIHTHLHYNNVIYSIHKQMTLNIVYIPLIPYLSFMHAK